MSVFVIAKSATSPTKVSSVAVLLPGLGSVVSEDTEAVFAIVPDAPVSTATSIVTDALPPTSMSPREHVTVFPDGLQDPWVGLADWKVTSEGRVSMTVTLMASKGPLLSRERVYVRGSPAWTGSGESVFVILRSAPAAGQSSPTAITPYGGTVVPSRTVFTVIGSPAPSLSVTPLRVSEKVPVGAVGRTSSV